MADVQVVHAFSKGRRENFSFLFLGLYIALDTNWLALIHRPMMVIRLHVIFLRNKA